MAVSIQHAESARHHPSVILGRLHSMANSDRLSVRLEHAGIKDLPLPFPGLATDGVRRIDSSSESIPVLGGENRLREAQLPDRFSP